jgi:hypothetical protein
VREASLINEAVLHDIRYEESQQGVSFAVIQLDVADNIVGESPDAIEIRRSSVTPDLEFLYTEAIPAYSVGERFITTLLHNKTNEEVFILLGLHNGKFVIDNNRIQNSTITVDRFKKLIKEIRAGTIDEFPRCN